MPPTGPSQNERPPPGEDDIRAQLARILESPDFRRASRLGPFLTYVVDEALAGRGKRIKGLTVAIAVFHRREDQAIDDPVVRIEARRLRHSLEIYYLTTGQNDPVRIDLPKGGYAPTFNWIPGSSDIFPDEPPLTLPTPVLETLPKLHLNRLVVIWGPVLALCAVGIAIWVSEPTPSLSTRPLDSTVDGPTLVIAPFAAPDNDPDAKLYALGLTEELLNVLPRFKELKVFGRETSATLATKLDAKDVRSRLGARYLLTGVVRVSANQVRVTARVVETASDTIIWTETYDGQLKTQGLFSIESSIANSVAASIAQPNGVISRADNASLAPDDLTAYGCTLHFYEYRVELSAEKHLSVRDCLESAVARYPQYATAWAMLSIVYLDEQRFKYNPKAGSPTALERSLTAARRAMEIDPANARAGQALMTSLFFNGFPEQSLQVGEQALRDNPNDTELLGEYGVRLAMSGQWAKGADTLETVLKQNPGAGGFYSGVLALAKYMQQDYRGAADQIQQANLQKFPLFHVVAAVIYAENGMKEAAANEGAKFKEMDPSFLRNLTAELETRIGRPEDRLRLVEGLRKAGMYPGTPATNIPQN